MHPSKRRLRKVRLCTSCNRLKLRLKKLEADADQQRQQGGGRPYLEREIRIHRTMIDCVQGEGRKYGRLYDDDLQPLRFEHEWRLLADRFLHADQMFYGYANSLNYSFGVNQRRYIFYLLSLMNREYSQRNRKRIAQAIIWEEDFGHH
jgi:hypothetical protein